MRCGFIQALQCSPRHGLGTPDNWGWLIQESMILRWKDQTPGVCPLMFHTEKLMGLSGVSDSKIIHSFWIPGYSLLNSCVTSIKTTEWWNLVQEAVSCVHFSWCYSSTGSAIRCVILAPWRCRNAVARSQVSQEVSGKSGLTQLFDCSAVKKPSIFPLKRSMYRESRPDRGLGWK